MVGRPGRPGRRGYHGGLSALARKYGDVFDVGGPSALSHKGSCNIQTRKTRNREP